MANTTLLKPTTIEAVVDEKNPNLAVITLEPFERGYGHTLGNALRRILLASMVGYAPTEASIVGVVHEYSQIDGVIEDVVDILLNLKGVIFKLEGGRQDVNLRLQKSGTGVVTAADFELPHDVPAANSTCRFTWKPAAAISPATCVLSATTTASTPWAAS